MILADKIIQLRKQNGWSQDELAEQIGVSRQAISKWEGAQSTPDLERIIKMSKLFGVTTDSLLNDEMEVIEPTEQVETTEALRVVSLEEANRYMAQTRLSSKFFAWAASLFITSPILMLVLSALSEHERMNETMAVAIGVTVLLLMIAGAVGLIIYAGIKIAPYEYIEKEPFETAYGVTGAVKNHQEAYRGTYLKGLIGGIALTILCVIPVLLSQVLPGNKDLNEIAAIAVLLVMVAVGVHMIVRVAVTNSSFTQLLQENDYTKEQKRKNRYKDPIIGAFWMLVIAGFLGYSLITRDWARSWIIFPVAGIITVALNAIIDAFTAGKS